MPMRPMRHAHGHAQQTWSPVTSAGHGARSRPEINTFLAGYTSKTGHVSRLREAFSNDVARGCRPSRALHAAPRHLWRGAPCAAAVPRAALQPCQAARTVGASVGESTCREMHRLSLVEHQDTDMRTHCNDHARMQAQCTTACNCFHHAKGRGALCCNLSKVANTSLLRRASQGSRGT